MNLWNIEPESSQTTETSRAKEVTQQNEKMQLFQKSIYVIQNASNQTPCQGMKVAEITNSETCESNQNRAVYAQESDSSPPGPKPI
jgi:hypothetical protein